MGMESKKGPEVKVGIGKSYKNWSQESPQTFAKKKKKKPSAHIHCLVEARETQTQPSHLRIEFSLEVSPLN